MNKFLLFLTLATLILSAALKASADTSVTGVQADNGFFAVMLNVVGDDYNAVADALGIKLGANAVDAFYVIGNFKTGYAIQAHGGGLNATTAMDKPTKIHVFSVFFNDSLSAHSLEGSQHISFEPINGKLRVKSGAKIIAPLFDPGTELNSIEFQLLDGPKELRKVLDFLKRSKQVVKEVPFKRIVGIFADDAEKNVYLIEEPLFRQKSQRENLADWLEGVRIFVGSDLPPFGEHFVTEMPSRSLMRTGHGTATMALKLSANEILVFSNLGNGTILLSDEFIQKHLDGRTPPYDIRSFIYNKKTKQMREVAKMRMPIEGVNLLFKGAPGPFIEKDGKGVIELVDVLRKFSSNPGSSQRAAQEAVKQCIDLLK